MPGRPVNVISIIDRMLTEQYNIDISAVTKNDGRRRAGERGRMRYLMFSSGGERRVGALVDGDTVVDLTAALSAVRSIRDIVAGGDALRREIEAAVNDAASTKQPLASCQLLSPLPDPGKVICLGLNYADHAKEGGHDLPDYPALFMRATTSLIGPGEPMIVPDLLGAA